MKNYKNVPSYALGLLCLVLFNSSCSQQETITPQQSEIQSPESWTIKNIAPGSGTKFGNAISNCKWQSSVGSLAGPGGDTDHEDYAVTYKDNQAFYETSNGYMVFITEEGKSERTELRDLGNRSFYEYHKLLWKGLVQNVDGNDEVTIAQIHNDGSVSRPLLRIYIKNRNIYAKMSENPTGTSTYLVSDDTDSRVWNKTGDGEVAWNDSDRLTVAITIREDGRLTVYVKNRTTGEVMDCFLTPNYSNWNSYDGNYYFKSGAYNQGSNTAARVSINHFEINPIISN